MSKKQPSWMTSDATSYQGEPMKTLQYKGDNKKQI